MSALSSTTNQSQSLVADEKAPPPPYQAVSFQDAYERNGAIMQPGRPNTPQNATFQPAYERNEVLVQKPNAHVPPQQQPFRFPQAFGIYHASGSLSDMILALQKDDPNPLFYISTHGAWSSQPSVVLYSNRSSSSPPLATADFHSFSSTIDMTLFMPNSQPQMCAMDTSGAFSYVRRFQAPIPSSGQLEFFEWKNSQGMEVQSLHGRGHGKKCVRVATGEVVAAFTHPDMSMSKKGKMSFLGDRSMLGEAFEIMCVMAILAVMEKERRKKRSNAAGSAGAM